MVVEFGKANLLQKARRQPDKVRQVLDKIRSDELMPAIDAVCKRLDEPLPLGYCNAGVVIETGPGVTGFQKGDRVASNGKHAEFVCVLENLFAKVPENVTLASFAALESLMKGDWVRGWLKQQKDPGVEYSERKTANVLMTRRSQPIAEMLVRIL